jgi:hypothetical protein
VQFLPWDSTFPIERGEALCVVESHRDLKPLKERQAPAGIPSDSDPAPLEQARKH